MIAGTFSQIQIQIVFAVKDVKSLMGKTDNGYFGRGARNLKQIEQFY